MTWRIHALALLALAAALLLPARARAAILPVCERDEVATVQAPPQDPVCEVVTTVDDVTGVTKAAPICDPRGASAVAPPRVLPVADARIEARPSCSFDDLSKAFTPSRDEAPPSGAPALALEPALLAPFGAVPWSGYVTGHDFLEPLGAARAGVRREIDRPPC
jgi:hypothetical protein